MEYTIQKLAQLAGISTRTLRYYDQIDLLNPAKVNGSGYRIYGEKEVDALQQILFHRELGLKLDQIKTAMLSSSGNRLAVLENHLKQLEKRRKELNLLIENVNQTIKKEAGKIKMTDADKFKGLRRQMLQENEEKYGEEIRERYGRDSVEKSNDKMSEMTDEEFKSMQEEGGRINMLLEEAVKAGEDPQSEKGRYIAKLHKEWLNYTWPVYSKEAHMGLVQMYVDDKRFRAYYDKNTEGCAEFLKNAVTAL